MTKGVLVLLFFLYFSTAKNFLLDVEDNMLEDNLLKDGNYPAGNDYGNTSCMTTLILHMPTQNPALPNNLGTNFGVVLVLCSGFREKKKLFSDLNVKT